MSRLSLLVAVLLCGCITRRPPVPPLPEPDPPVVVVDVPAPPVEGLHVLIWRETDTTRVPEPELEQYTGKVRAWLKANADFRIWDQGIDAVNEPPEWQAAAKLKPASLPWIIISNGTSGHSGPLPKTTDETIALLEKFR